MLLCFLSFYKPPRALNEITRFIWFSETLFLIYLIYPFYMVVNIGLALLFSILFEIGVYHCSETNTYESLPINIIVKFLLHFSLHLIALYSKYSLAHHKRTTFVKVAHMHTDKMWAEKDKDITNRMIKSIMPPSFTHLFGKPEAFKESVNCFHIMRPLFIYPISHLSILFADIVGFTRMSSIKTAEQLVFLLNDLYGRFDKLCEKTGCEKISTLGDCYYCVSGCLNGRVDHAKCCVEMGLMMIKEIEIFNRVHNVDINMRVGVHTGKALCGFMGGKRFRFDVWSGDVTLANKMESTGRAGGVHISEDTYKELNQEYNIEPGDKNSGKATYFVVQESRKETVADAINKNRQINEIRPNQEDLSVAGSVVLNHLETSSKEQVDSSTVAVNLTTEQKESRNDLDLGDDGLSLAAVKNIVFFRPQINMITYHFRSSSELQFASYQVSLNLKIKKIENKLKKYGFV
jgi:class 3 adenylate cyclase